jgi:putative transposase
MLLQCVGMLDQTQHFRPIGKLFLAVRLQNRHSNLLVQQIERLRHATRKTLNAIPFQTDEILVMLAAIHTIWTLPE